MMNTLKLTISAMLLLSLGAQYSPAQQSIHTVGTMGPQPAMDSAPRDIMYHIVIYDELTEYLDGLFEKFSEGYMDPDTALTRVLVMKNEYKKKVEPVPPETEKLHALTKQLFSYLENYFIHYKRAYREHPFINMQILDTRIQLEREISELRFKYMS